MLFFSCLIWHQIPCFIFILFYFLLYFALQYCIGFAIHWHESTTGVYKLPILNPPPASHPISSLWIIPTHQPQNPVSCIEHRLLIAFSIGRIAFLSHHKIPPVQEIFWMSSILPFVYSTCFLHLSSGKYLFLWCLSYLAISIAPLLITFG